MTVLVMHVWPNTETVAALLGMAEFSDAGEGAAA